MVWLPRPIGHRPSCAPPRPRSAMTDGHMQIRTRHIGQSVLMTIRASRHTLYIRDSFDHPCPQLLPVCWAWHTNPSPTLLSWLSTGKKTRGGAGAHTLRTHVDGGSHIRTIKTGPKEPHDGSTGRLALFGTFRVDHCPSFLHAPSPRSSHTLIPVFTPRRLWASWGCR